MPIMSSCDYGEAYVTKDKSAIRELIHVTSAQSLAEAKVSPENSTLLHRHDITDTREKELRILCCCYPAYSHEDTKLFE
jgi:hypothetical protein